MTNQSITLAAGCFWCVEEIFKQLKGVISVTSGYSGGEKVNPTYREVCNGDTGHAEAVQIEFNPDEVSLETILEVFWKVHDPTTLNKQGADEGTQYRSAIFYNNDEQKEIAEKSKAEMDASHYHENKIVTEITPFKNFYKAEDYHQNYYENNPDQGYCRIVIDPKIKKFKKEFFEKLKQSYT